MTTVRRLRKELQDLQESNLKSFRFLSVDDDNLLHWSLLILPNEPPYNKGAFRVEIEFPKEYPFQPPKIVFKTKIYHPNINEKGQVCLNIINPEHWKPSTRIGQVIESLIVLVNKPEPDHPLRADLGEEFQLNYKKFIKNAEEFTKKFSETRPTQ